MAKPISYREQEKIENTVKLREFLKELPPYVKDYFRAKEPTTSDKTRLSYAYDLRVFFRFLKESNPALKEKSICDISLDDLSSLKPVDFEEFEEFLKAYQTADGRLETNSRVGIARKMSCLRSFYEYLCKRQLVPYNPVRMVDMPRVKEKAIIQLDPDEVVTLLDHIENYGNVNIVTDRGELVPSSAVVMDNDNIHIVNTNTSTIIFGYKFNLSDPTLQH